MLRNTERAESVTAIEQHGVESVPDAERASGPKDLFFVFFGSQMCFAIIVLGSLPITFGLGFWDSVTSITAGLAFGSLIFGLLSPLGAKTGANGATASGAHFGVSGRVIGTVIAIFTGLGCYALTVWTGGEAIAAGTARLFSVEATADLNAAGAALICLCTIIAAIYGHAIIVASEKLVSYTIAAVLLVAAAIILPDFDPSYSGGEYILSAYWPTWFLSVAIAAAIPISYATFLNDYTRYIPSSTPDKSLVWAGGGGMFIGCWIALVFAAAVTSTFADKSTSFVTGLINMVPLWMAALLALTGLIGSQPQGSLLLYGSGLGAQSMMPSLHRVTATVILSIAGLAVVYTGIYGESMLQLVTAFLVIDQCVLAPWVAVNIIGYHLQNGGYDTQDLYKFNDAQGSGRYWYKNGWSMNGIVAWGSGAALGLMLVNTEFYKGPLSDLVGGVSMEWILAGATSACLYYLLERRSAVSRTAQAR